MSSIPGRLDALFGDLRRRANRIASGDSRARSRAQACLLALPTRPGYVAAAPARRRCQSAGSGASVRLGRMPAPVPSRRHRSRVRTLTCNSSASCCWVRSFSVICPREVGRPDSLGRWPARHARPNGDGLWRVLTGYDGRGRAWLGVRRHWPPGRPRCGAHPKLQAAKRAGAAALSTRRPRPVGRSCPTATPRLQNRPVRLTQTGGGFSTATPNRAEFAGSRTASSASRPVGVTGCDGGFGAF
jgi:hypothetical protein